jgi:glycosyl transferase family 87
MSGRTDLAFVRTALPVIAVVVFASMTLAILATAGSTWGYDYQAYAQAAQRLLGGQRLYEPGVALAGGFAIYLYPPPFALAFVPFAWLGDPLGLYAWTAVLIGCTVVAIAAMPVSVTQRWVLLLLAGLDWPVLYSLKLGQVGPILLLLFVLGWRWLDRDRGVGAAIGIGALVKVQPALLGIWAALTGRSRAALVGFGVAAGASLATLPIVGIGAWADYVAVLRQVSRWQRHTTSPLARCSTSRVWTRGLPQSFNGLLSLERSQSSSSPRGGGRPPQATSSPSWRANWCRRSCGITTRSSCYCQLHGSLLVAPGGR